MENAKYIHRMWLAKRCKHNWDRGEFGTDTRGSEIYCLATNGGIERD
jgi:hypothetical protein